MSLSPSKALLLDCLVQARHILGDANVREIYLKTEFTVDLSAVRLVTAETRAVEGVKTLTIPSLADYAPIEQREAMLYIIALRSNQLRQDGHWNDFPDLCIRLGCLCDNSSIISERWRKLAIMRDISDLPYSSLENRPVCKVCSGRVATYAGWRPEESGFDPLVYGDYRSDVHHECKQYALKVMLPRLRAMQAERARATAEVDK